MVKPARRRPDFITKYEFQQKAYLVGKAVIGALGEEVPIAQSFSKGPHYNSQKPTPAYLKVENLYEGFITGTKFTSQQMTLQDCYNLYIAELTKAFGTEIVEFATTAAALNWEV